MNDFLSLSLLLLAIGLVLCGGIVYLLAQSLLRPPRMTDGKAAWVLKRLSPGDLGLAFEETRFHVRDPKSHERIDLAAWWIPHRASGGRCAVFLHGYADAKVGSIAWALTWHALGWNVLALDLRAHGESTGRYCTGGDAERHDVSQVIDQLRARRPDDTRQIVLFGASFGSAVAVATAADREDIGGVVLDSPVPDFAAAAMTQMNLFGAPSGLLRHLAIKLAEKMSGADFRSARMLDLLPRLTCPVLVIAPEHDALLEGPAGTALRGAFDARPAGAETGTYWHVAGAGHLSALAADPDAYRDRLAAFLPASLPASAAAGPR